MYDEWNAIASVVIDKGRDAAEENMRKGIIRVELGEDGVAKILHMLLFARNEDGSPKYIQVDRASGQFLSGDFFPLVMTLRDDILKYVEAHAQRLEGKETKYSPDQLDPQAIQNAYELAIRHGIIEVRRNHPDGDIDFSYQGYKGFSGFYYGKMDLAEGVLTDTLGDNSLSLIMTRKAPRPLHPQFVEFLRQKKAELEGTTAKS